jgi:site-specific recombinase XerD
VVRLQRERSRLQAAADAFLAQPDLAPSSRRSYGQTTRRLVAVLGGDRDVGEFDPNKVEYAFRQAWSGVAPATWNRHLAALGSFADYCRRRGWLTADLIASLERRPEKADRTRVASVLELERLWSRDDVALRERCLWRLLYETAARAEEVLSLNVEDVDAASKRAVVISKGGDREDNVSLPLLMAKSRHENLRSLQRYVRPSSEAVAALTAQHDPARRRRG